jgi:integrase/recombinase XerC
VDAILEEFDEYLKLERDRSEHTRRAYLGDLRSLFDFLAERVPDAAPTNLTLPVLRSWLASQASRGAARTVDRRSGHAAAGT